MDSASFVRKETPFTKWKLLSKAAQSGNSVHKGKLFLLRGNSFPKKEHLSQRGKSACKAKHIRKSNPCFTKHKTPLQRGNSFCKARTPNLNYSIIMEVSSMEYDLSDLPENFGKHQSTFEIKNFQDWVEIDSSFFFS